MLCHIIIFAVFGIVKAVCRATRQIQFTIVDVCREGLTSPQESWTAAGEPRAERLVDRRVFGAGKSSEQFDQDRSLSRRELREQFFLMFIDLLRPLCELR